MLSITSFAPLVEQVRPSVVQVRSGGRGQGTGVIWRSDGAILTNNHVIAGARGRIEVLLTDGRRFDADVTAASPELDLALLKVDARDLPAAAVGDSEQLRVGDLVFALGHPWGQPWVLTAGIVSGLGETPEREKARPAPFIRSDVRLRPGNSGGPLLDAGGAVVGINAMVFGGDLSVAIPVNIASGWIAAAPATRGVLGASVQRAAVPADLRRGAWADRQAALLVVAVAPGGAAERGRLQAGDLVLDVDGVPVERAEELRAALDRRAGQAARFYVARGGAVAPVDIRI
jgi:serine protease Do